MKKSFRIIHPFLKNVRLVDCSSVCRGVAGALLGGGAPALFL
jgi:hypothetical protein